MRTSSNRFCFSNALDSYKRKVLFINFVLMGFMRGIKKKFLSLCKKKFLITL